MVAVRRAALAARMPPKRRSRRGRATPAGARSGPAPLGSHVRRNLVAYLALFVALGGTAAAAKPVLTGADIQDGSLSAADVAAANTDGTADTLSLRTLGKGAQQAASGPSPSFR